MFIKKIDIHVHAAPHKEIPRFWSDNSDYTTPEELRAIYDQMGIEKGVQLTAMAAECGIHVVTNEMSMQMVIAHPDTFYWFCYIDPRWGQNSPNTDFSYFLNYYKARGAKGVGEMTANVYFDDPRTMNLFRHCEACDMPVLFHIGNMGGDYGLVDELGLPRLEKVLSSFPKLQFLAHSQKFWAEISGNCTEEIRDDYPTGAVVPGGRVIELLDRYPNLTCDLSAGSGGNAMMRDPEFGLWFMEKYQNRLYFGTDFCSPEDQLPLSQYLDDCVEQGKLSETAYVKICRENALRLLERPMK